MSTRGRPRELPSQLPRLNPSIALDSALEGINLRSRGAILEDSRHQCLARHGYSARHGYINSLSNGQHAILLRVAVPEVAATFACVGAVGSSFEYSTIDFTENSAKDYSQRRQAKQTDRARTLARQRGRRHIEELALAYLCAKAAGVTDESKAMLKRCLAEVVLQVTEHDVRQFYFHVEHFMRYAVDQTPVFTQQHYDNSHVGDEPGLCPILPDTVEALLVSYLPNEFGQFTPEQHRQLEEAFGVQRLTMQAIEALVNGGQPSDVEQSVAL